MSCHAKTGPAYNWSARIAFIAATTVPPLHYVVQGGPGLRLWLRLHARAIIINACPSHTDAGGGDRL